MPQNGDGLLINSDGTQVVQLRSSSGAEPAVSATNTDGVFGTSNALGAIALSYGHNGASWDRWRNNTSGTLLASAERTADGVSANQINYNARGIMLMVNVTNYVSGSLTVVLLAIDSSGTQQYLINAYPTAITATGRYLYVLYPGATSTGNDVKQASSMILPKNWRLYVSNAASTRATYQVDYSLIV